MNPSKINSVFSTTNFILVFIGYQFITSLLLPVSSNDNTISNSVTIPYRAFALLLAILVIFLNFKKPYKSISFSLIIFFIFSGLFVVRIIYDVFVRTDINIKGDMQLWLYIFAICLPIVLSILRSHKKIELYNAFYWILGLTFLTLIISIITNSSLIGSSENINERLDANVALNTISFGHLGTTSVILGIYFLFNRKKSLIIKAIVILFTIIGFIIMLRAGSRGPIVSLIFVLFFWIFSRNKNNFSGMLFIVLFFIIAFIFLDQILQFIGFISPVTESRLRFSIDQGDTGNREFNYLMAIMAFLESPIIGKQFAIPLPDGNFVYAHNIFLDAIMGLGVIGGILIIYILFTSMKICNYLIKKDYAHYWICLILIQQTMYLMTSSAFYYNPLLAALLTFLFVNFDDLKKQMAIDEIENQNNQQYEPTPILLK